MIDATLNLKDKYAELIALISKCESEIQAIEDKKLFHKYKNDTVKQFELSQEQKFLKRKIVLYINEFRKQIKDNYLAQKVFESALKSLEYHFTQYGKF